MNSATLRAAITATTAKWTKQRRAERREASRAANRRDAWYRETKVTVKSAAYAEMPRAYQKASANGTLPAGARQIMYAARGAIQDATGDTMNDAYFTQTLLPDFMAENPELTEGWDVVFDARGHFTEPHTGNEIPLGTIDVRAYLAGSEKRVEPLASQMITQSLDFPTYGPEHRYGAILFIEKEGFMPLLNRVRLAERFDIGIMSTKGMSVTASRILVDRLCGEHEIPLLVLHDFDKSGFSIAASLRNDGRRYSFRHDIRLIDMGLRLADVEEWELESEQVSYGKSDPRANLAENGATEEEVAFLLNGSDYSGYAGKRVELNAFTSDAFIAWIESKLAEHGIAKVIPNADTLKSAYRRAAAIGFFNRRMKELEAEAAEYAKALKIPADLRKRVAQKVEEDRSMPWDSAVGELAEGAPA